MLPSAFRDASHARVHMQVLYDDIDREYHNADDVTAELDELPFGAGFDPTKRRVKGPGPSPSAVASAR